MRSDETAKRAVKKATKTADPMATFCPHLPSRISHNGLTLRFDSLWATHRSSELEHWCLDLFARNMRELYTRSNWGYDLRSKEQELGSTTARFLIVYRLSDPESEGSEKPVAYCHYRFVIDNNQSSVYCYELQVESEAQQQGIGTLLIRRLLELAQKSGMGKTLATVFAFNAASLAFFRKHGFTLDETTPHEESDCDYFVLSRYSSIPLATL